MSRETRKAPNRITQTLPLAPPPSPQEFDRFRRSFAKLTGREPRDYELNLHSLLWQTNVERRRKLASENSPTDNS